MNEIAITRQGAEALSTGTAKQPAGSDFYVRYSKTLVDFCLGLLILPIVAPIVLVLWAIVRLDGGPGFFGHTRVGLNRDAFKCWKIRTMVPDAEKRLTEYLASNPEAAEEWARDHKLTNDPRITKIGHFLRKSSLDELPQLWNVFCGQMSFVGPRPVVTKELDKYGSNLDAYLAQKPGITGLWQISGRNDISYDERVQMDVTYLSMRSLRTDLSIILKTGLVLLNHTGR